METSSLFSSDSTSTSTSKRQRLHPKTLVDGITRFLHSQGSRTSLRSQVSASSGLSRALVLWHPRFDYSPNSSRSASVATTPTYPVSDPTRLQSFTQTLVDDQGKATKTAPAVSTKRFHAIIDEAATAQTVSASLSSYSQGEMRQRAFAAIKQTVKDHAAAADEEFVTTARQYMLINSALLETKGSETENSILQKSVLPIVEAVLKTSSTAASILIAQKLLSSSTKPGCSRSAHKVLEILSILGLNSAYHDNVFCTCAQVIVHEPHDCVRDLIIELSKCLVEELAIHLSDTSATLMVAKLEYVRLLYVYEYHGAFEQLWVKLKNCDVFASTHDPVKQVSLQKHIGRVALDVRDYTAAMHHLEGALETCVQKGYSGDFRANVYFLLARCNYELGRHAIALEQAELAKRELSEATTTKGGQILDAHLEILSTAIRKAIERKDS